HLYPNLNMAWKSVLMALNPGKMTATDKGYIGNNCIFTQSKDSTESVKDMGAQHETSYYA
ncbi:hypothetical protein HK100_000636, partial [Physocladia obscura]